MSRESAVVQAAAVGTSADLEKVFYFLGSYQNIKIFSAKILAVFFTNENYKLFDENNIKN